MSTRNSWMLWLALPLLGGLAYGAALDNPFAYDDTNAIVGNAFIRQVDLPSIFFRGGISSTGFGNGQFRPLTMLTFMLDYQIGGLDPFGYRLVNLALHVLNALLAAWVLRKLLVFVPLAKADSPPDRGRLATVGVMAAALFLLHPMNSLSVLLVWKRATLLLTSFSLLAVAALLSLRQLPPTSSRRRRVALHVAVWAAQLLALGAKESAAILPAMLLLVDLWPRDGVPLRERWRELVRLHAPAWLLGGAAAAFLLTRDVPDVEISRWVYLATQMKVIWSYLAMMVAPSMVSTVYDVVPARLGDGFVWLAGLALLSLLASTVWLYRRWPFVALALWWATLALAPTSTLIPIPLLEDEDRTYLAFLPLWVLPAHALLWLGDVRPRLSRWLVRAGGSLVLLLLLGLTLARGVLWSDRELLWYEASKRHPDSVVAAGYYCLALLGRSDRAAPALSHCTRAQQRFPENQTLQLGVIRAYVGVGDIAKAEAALASFLAMGKPSHQILRMAGHLAWFRNRPAEAIDYYRRLLKLQPFDLEAVLYMARCYAELGSMAEARSLAGELDRWATPLARDFRITLAELHRTIGWTQRACREFEMLRADSHGRHAASPEWQRLSSACTTH